MTVLICTILLGTKIFTLEIEHGELIHHFPAAIIGFQTTDGGYSSFRFAEHDRYECVPKDSN